MAGPLQWNTQIMNSQNFFNYICSANENQWEKSPSYFSYDRFLEYTDDHTLSQLRSTGDVLGTVKNLPTMFAYEDFVDKPSRVGSITKLLRKGAELVIHFSLNDDFQTIDDGELQFELDLHPFEFSRTHWAVKNVELTSLLNSRNLAIPKSQDKFTTTPTIALPLPAPTGDTPSPEKTNQKVFISYSHADAEYLERLMLHLKPLKDRVELELWSDTKLVGGDEWKREIERNLNTCSIAVLLISADFLASDFVTKYELPPLLQKAEEGGCRIVPIIVQPCMFTAIDELSKFQTINDPKEALSGQTASKREEIYAKTAMQILDIAKLARA